ncbi:TonB-dependent receptor plug domain-containing protein [Flammeovirga agarivorans]|uniref:TonB-dependent receptor n=1 Tax=Flammeovirga agarivorans TaxID=2726742 RepID=A0A7X8SKL1_9BACT|nr:TonB-dependent receptor [Flammeovirga agarivorans]NLR91961.1 TonB-dependent receptor [Flammeovirga agarivorans]
MRLKGLMAVLFFISTYCVGQEYQLPDRELKEVEITAKSMKYYSQGAHIQTFDSTEMQFYNEGTLATLLRDKASVYIREYGAPGQLSSISIRGASPENTAIVWNGINLNSLTLGQTDMSTINTFYFDNIDLQYGASSAQYGSGAVGGTIILKDQLDWERENHFELQTAYGSFNQQFYGFKAQYGNNKWKHKTVGLYQMADNDYTFYNEYAKEDQVQQNAGFWHAGILHETHFKPNENEEWSVNLWYTQDQRGIQPIMGNNMKPSTYDSTENTNFRGVVNYKVKNDKWTHTASVAYIQDELLNGGSQIATQRVQGDYRGETSLTNSLTLQTGLTLMNIWPDVYAYAADTEEFRGSVFAALRWDVTNRFNVSTTLRQTVVTGYSAPFTPSLNLSYIALEDGSQSLKIKSSAGRSYRVPTLNERYWGEKANPDIKPEDGYNVDLGFDYTKSNNHLTFNTSVTGFYLRTFNKILWIPGNPTYAANVKETYSRGVEVSADIGNQYSKQLLKWKFGAAYSFTDAQNLDKDKQLMYVPKNLIRSYINLGIATWSLNIDGNFVGKRTTANDYYNLDAYQLLNVGLSKWFKINNSRILLTAKVNNITNSEYQNYEEYPMPGINYMFKANFNF